MAESKRARTRKSIIDAGLQLFEEFGYDDVKIMSIIEKADVSRMTFFRYFPSRVDLIKSQFIVEKVADYIPDAPAEYHPTKAICWATQWHANTADQQNRTRLIRILNIVANSSSLCAQVFGPQSDAENVYTDKLISRGVDKVVARSAAGAALGANSGVMVALREVGPLADLEGHARLISKVLLNDEPV